MRPPLVFLPRRAPSWPVAVSLFFLALHSLLLGGNSAHVRLQNVVQGNHAQARRAACSMFASAAIVVLATNESLPGRTAAFGPQLVGPPGMVAQLVSVELVDPENQKGCRPLVPASIPPPTNRPWIALVERGGCSFVDKARNMQASNADAIVVGDPDRDGFVTMLAAGDTTDIKIPSVFVAQAQYQQLRRTFAVLTRAGGYLKLPLLVMLVEDGTFQPELDFIVIMLLTPVGLFLFIYGMYRVHSSSDTRNAAHLATPAYVSSLPTKFYFATKRRGREPVDCAVCLEDYVDEDELRILPCGHEYQVACVDPWLTKRRKCCPICKSNVCADEVTPLLSVRYVEFSDATLSSLPLRVSRNMRTSQTILPPRPVRARSEVVRNGSNEPYNTTSSVPVVSSTSRFLMSTAAVPSFSSRTLFPGGVPPASYGARTQQRHAGEGDARGSQERQATPAPGGHSLLPHTRAPTRSAQLVGQ